MPGCRTGHDYVALDGEHSLAGREEREIACVCHCTRAECCSLEVRIVTSVKSRALLNIQSKRRY